MSNVNDELLADLMDDDDDNSDLQSDAGSETSHPQANEDGDVEMVQDAAVKSALDEAEDQEDAKQIVEKINFSAVNDVGSISGLSKTLAPVLEKIKHYQSLPPDQQMQSSSNIEDHPEYKLLVSANSLSSGIDNEIILIHKFIRDHYSIRFPELETIIQNPLTYARAVAILGNGPFDNASMDQISSSSDNIVGQTLRQVLDGGTMMVTRLEASKTSGRELTAVELETVQRATKTTINLDKARDEITAYVQSKMSVYAPNLTEFIGAETATMILGYTGSLKELSKVPATNIPAMGSKKQTFGMATNTRVRRQGFLYHSPMIQNLPMDLRNKGMRIAAAKLILCARIDASEKYKTGEEGRKIKDECFVRLDKLTAPPPNTSTKPLPAPNEPGSRKRGGRRARAAKAATAMTELRQAQNRMAFGKEEVNANYDDDEGLGMIGNASIAPGKIRVTQVDQRTKAKLSKKNPGWGFETPNQNHGGLASSLHGFGSGAGNATVLKGHGLRTSGVATGAAAGTSSVIFSQYQGLELVNPKAKEEMERKRKAEEDGWFKSGTFTSVKTSESKTDAAGFKVPALPAIKRVKQ